MATADQYIERAAGYIGVSGTDNIFNTWIWGHHCYDPSTYPWCAAFQSYVGVHDMSMPFEPSASAAGVASQGARTQSPQRGDWVLFNWDGRQDFSWADHIGVVEWFDAQSGYFGTIEGNCDDMVKRVTRTVDGGYATAFYRPPYDERPEPTEGDFDMAECIFHCKDNYGGYKAGDVVYWSTASGFQYLEHPDCITLLKKCSPGIVEIDNSAKYPWLTRAKQATDPDIAARTYGKRV